MKLKTETEIMDGLKKLHSWPVSNQHDRNRRRLLISALRWTLGEVEIPVFNSVQETNKAEVAPARVGDISDWGDATPEERRELERRLAAKSGQHTPGPWTINRALIECATNNPHYRPAPVLQITTQSTGVSRWHIATVMRQGKDTEANARLIAAAPDLLEALRKIHDNPYTTCQCGDIARAAITKAERGMA